MSNISSMFGNLGLSPATIAGLANASGLPAGMPASDPEMQALAQRWNSVPEETPEAPAAGPSDGSNAHSAPAPGPDPMTAPFAETAAPPSPAPSGPQPWNAPQPAAAAQPASMQQMAQQFAAQDKGQSSPASGAAAGPPATTVTVPAHWQPGSHAVSIQHGMTPGELEPAQYNQNVAAGHELMAADKRFEAAQQRGAAEGAFAAAKTAADNHFAQLDAAREARRKSYVADELEKLNQLTTESKKQVDPNAIWKERGTLGSVLTGLMVGIGQFASMWKGGQNAAMQVVNDQINQNIDAQKANIANAHADLANEKDLYRINLDAFGDEERATLASKMQYLDHVAGMVNQIKAGASDADTVAAKHDLIAKIYQQQGALAKDFAQLSHSKITEQESEHFVPTQTLGGGAGAKREGNLVTTSDGTTYHLGTEVLAKDAIGKVQSLGNLKFLANQILAKRQELAKMPFAGEEAKRQELEISLKKLTRELMTAESKAAEQGVVTKTDAESDKEIGLSGDSDMSRWSNFNPYASTNRQGTDASYRDMISRWQKQEHQFVQAAGGEVYNRDYMRTPDGRLVPSGSYTGQDAKADAQVAPAGSKPIDSRIANLPTASKPAKQTLPKAPVRDVPFAPAAAVPAKKKGHRK